MDSTNAGDQTPAASTAGETTAADGSADTAAVAAVDTDGGQQASGGTSRKVAQSNLLDSFKGVFSSLPDYGLKIAAGLLALLGVLFIWQRRKSRKEFDESMMDIESEEVSLNSETSIQRMSDASGIDLASASDSALELTIGGGMSYLSEEGIAGVNEEDNEVIKAGAVDPLAEADVYLAYDRDEQAVQVLKEAYADTPERGELAEKLLEIYHKQDDRRAFDALAGRVASSDRYHAQPELGESGVHGSGGQPRERLVCRRCAGRPVGRPMAPWTWMMTSLMTHPAGRSTSTRAA